MELVETIRRIQALVYRYRKKELSIGLVPTMGALHEGHMSLIEASTRQNGITVVSIFVNPTQFTDPRDFMNYPRDLNRDREILRKKGVDVLFVPSVQEIYPLRDERTFDLGGMDRTMEGKCRPGHFNGVAQIITRLFDVIGPDRAYFGEKDYQQLVIIRYLTGSLGIPVKIIACPVVREQDGLAMSSRNMLLDPRQRAASVIIPDTMRKVNSMAFNQPVESIKEFVAIRFKAHPLAKLEYFDIVSPADLRPLDKWPDNEDPRACIAVRMGRVRLIDNIRMTR